jgi:hypothetical protein
VKIPEGWFPIPESAGDPNTSGLTGEVRAGTSLDIEIK